MPYVNRPIPRPYYDNDYDCEGRYESGYDAFLGRSAHLIGRTLLDGKDINGAYEEAAKAHGISKDDFPAVKAAAERARRARLEFEILLNIAQNRNEIDAVEAAARSFNLPEAEVLAIAEKLLNED